MSSPPNVKVSWEGALHVVQMQGSEVGWLAWKPHNKDRVYGFDPLPQGSLAIPEAE